MKRVGMFYLFLWFLLVTILFTTIVVVGGLDSIDETVRIWFDRIIQPAVVTFSKMVTVLAHTETLAIFTIIVSITLLIRKKFRDIIFFLSVLGGSIVITFIMKITIERDRPGEIEYISVWGLGDNVISYSYPSGHAVKGLILLGFFIYLINQIVPKKRSRFVSNFLLTVTIIFIGVGQLVLNKHYLSDVLGGYLVGITWFSFCLVAVPRLIQIFEPQFGKWRNIIEERQFGQ